MLWLAPVTVVLGGGASMNFAYKSDYAHAPAPVVDAFLGTYVHERIALGAHGGFAAVKTGGADTLPDVMWDNVQSLFDLGPALQVNYGRWYVEGWLGYHVTSEQRTTKTWPDDPESTLPPTITRRREVESVPAYGLVVGRDLMAPPYRATWYVEAQWSVTDHASDDYTALSLGVALRY